MSGTVNISRRLFDSEAFKNEPFTEREAWVWLVMEASWKDRTVRAGDYVADTKRGQLAASVRFMAKAWSWTPAKVQRYLKRVEKLKMICSKTDTGVSVITICNYDKYQNGAQAADTGPIQDRYRTDTNEKKEERREEKKEGAHAPLVPFVGEDLAKGFLAHRKALKSPMTPYAVELMAKRLSEIPDAVRATQDAIQNGWKSVYAPKDGTPLPKRRDGEHAGAFGFIKERG